VIFDSNCLFIIRIVNNVGFDALIRLARFVIPVQALTVVIQAHTTKFTISIGSPLPVGRRFVLSCFRLSQKVFFFKNWLQVAIG